LVDTAFDAYRKRDQRATLLAKLSGCHMFNAKLTMVGVWDTVGALGIPAIFGGVDVLLYGFLDTSLHENVLNAYHALAIDERRIEFPATLWTSPPKPGQTIDQVWFCGVHSDVGGGYPIQTGDSEGLADITLSWMMTKAAALGLNVNPEIRARYSLPVDAKFALDTLHESWNVLWGFPKRRPIAATASIADSVVIRCQHHDGWQPKNLELQNGIPASHYVVANVVTAPALGAAG
jgi:T6SS, Phospholipase effector Tle1-like, catalytic domain